MSLILNVKVCVCVFAQVRGHCKPRPHTSVTMTTPLSAARWSRDWLLHLCYHGDWICGHEQMMIDVFYSTEAVPRQSERPYMVMGVEAGVSHCRKHLLCCHGLSLYFKIKAQQVCCIWLVGLTCDRCSLTHVGPHNVTVTKLKIHSRQTEPEQLQLGRWYQTFWIRWRMISRRNQ